MICPQTTLLLLNIMLCSIINFTHQLLFVDNLFISRYHFQQLASSELNKPEKKQNNSKTTSVGTNAYSIERVLQQFVETTKLLASFDSIVSKTSRIPN